MYIELDKFKPREYQLPFLNAIEKKGYRRALLTWPRRAGKDIVCWNLCIRAALRKVQVIYYIFPTYSQGKKVIFDSITNDGQRILDYIPKEVVHSINTQEMKIRFINGSLLQVVGSDSYDGLMGTNPQMCVFSEYALQDPRAYKFLRPILLANGGTAVFISTPRGHNAFYDLYQIAKNDVEWFCEKLTVDDTGHISIQEIEKDIARGEYSFDFAQQEFYTSFELGVEGAYYTKALERCRFNNQITNVPWDISHRVWTAWDLGYRDSTAIIFFQFVGSAVHIIDCYQNSKEGLEHYIRYVQSKPYIYAGHIAPHDIAVTEFGSGLTRYEQAQQLGIDFTVAHKLSLMDGIEAVRASMSRVYFDKIKCAPLLDALESYRQEYDTKNKIYKTSPLHDSSSHFSDSFRYLCVSLNKMGEGMTEQDAQDMYNRALSGGRQSDINSPYTPPTPGITGRMPY